MNISQSSWIKCRDWMAFALSHHIIMGIYLLILRNFLPQVVPDFEWQHYFMRVFIVHIIYIIISYFIRITRYPPGPPPMAVFGNSPFVNILTPEQTFLEYREIYGPIFTLHLSQPTIILAEYKTIQEALVKNGQQTSGRSSAESFVLFTGDRLNGDGVILAMRQKWKDMRHEISRFMNKWYGAPMDELVLHHTRCLEQELAKIAETKSLIDLRDPLAGAIANVIQQITIGRNYMYQDQEFQTQLRDINAVVKEIMTAEVFFVNCYPWLRYLPEGILRKWTNYKRSGFRLQQWFRTILEEHHVNRHQGDFMSHMIDLQESKQEQFRDLSIILTCGDMWTGGMETTVTTLRWGIIYLLNNPEVQAKCQMEILDVFGNDIPDMGKMNQTPYVRATLSEIQRLANVLPWAIPHKTIEECNIGGYDIPVNTEIIPALGAVLFDPNVFESPKQFKPERFLDEEGKYRVMEEFRPFGLGPRVCLGERIARTELYLIFASLLQNFRFYLNRGDPIPVAERVIGGITAPPKPYATRVEYLGNRLIN
ncbi:Cytochrome P450 [Caenorhabditis elegans]|nr:Cytochrome P450 [Caenorhabditis elegans]VVC12387.1 Cytochrome P450 [Caenorhabditis elegans]